MADADGQGWADEHIAQALSVHANTVRGERQRFMEEGLEAAVGRKRQRRPPHVPLLDGEKEAPIAPRCSAPPPGQGRWTLHLLADQLVELQVVENISHETVRKALKSKRPARHWRPSRGLPCAGGLRI